MITTEVRAEMISGTWSSTFDHIFFDGTVRSFTCVKCGIMLYQSRATMGLCNRCHFSKVVLQHISRWLCVNSSKNQCIGWGCATSPLPLPWWPCSPNLSIPDISLAPTVHCESSLLIPASLEHHEFQGRGHKWCDDARTMGGGPTEICQIHTMWVGWNK